MLTYLVLLAIVIIILSWRVAHCYVIEDMEQRSVSSRFSGNSETFASELLDNLELMFLCHL